MVKNPRWAAVGESFSQFRPERESATPSERNILGFLLSRVWVWIRGLVVRIRVRGSVMPANVQGECCCVERGNVLVEIEYSVSFMSIWPPGSLGIDSDSGCY
jgi:hypothetical protein